MCISIVAIVGWKENIYSQQWVQITWLNRENYSQDLEGYEN